MNNISAIEKTLLGKCKVAVNGTDKHQKVTYGLLIALLMWGGGVVWWLSDLNTTVKTHVLTGSHPQIVGIIGDMRTDLTVLKTQGQISAEKLTRLEDKLDRLIEERFFVGPR